MRTLHGVCMCDHFLCPTQTEPLARRRPPRKNKSHVSSHLHSSQRNQGRRPMRHSSTINGCHSIIVCTVMGSIRGRGASIQGTGARAQWYVYYYNCTVLREARDKRTYDLLLLKSSHPTCPAGDATLAACGSSFPSLSEFAS